VLPGGVAEAILADGETFHVATNTGIHRSVDGGTELGEPVREHPTELIQRQESGEPSPGRATTESRS
jgi:hypothetical protein